MLRATGLSLMCLAMFSIAGGHWAVLQTVAWAQMLRDYSKDATVAEAVEKTFSGEAPCSLCVQIDQARQQEEKLPATVKVDKKAEIVLLSSHDILNKPFGLDFSYPSLGDVSFATRSNSPPVPVPIHAA